MWYAREDSNLWPLAPEASALSAELRAQTSFGQLYPSSRADKPTARWSPRSQGFQVAFVAAMGLPFTGYRGAAERRRFLLTGGLMSSRDSVSEPGRVRLNEEDVAYVMNVLRNATQPVNTQQLIDVLRRHPGQFQTTSESSPDSPVATPG